MLDPDLTECNVVMHKVNVDLNMFGPLMMNRISREVDSRDIITINKSGRLSTTAKVRKKLMKPGGISNCICDNMVFSVST